VRQIGRLVLGAALVWPLLVRPVSAQDERHIFIGALVGMSALQADAEADGVPPNIRASLYAPKLGPALDLFAGWHLADYFSVQVDYIWNRNDLRLVSSVVAEGDARGYEQHRDSAQHAVVADTLVYFRNRDSRIRPYLGTGLVIVRFASDATGVTEGGLAPPPDRVTETHLAVRSHVGIDVALTSAFSLRYSFSETIGGNPISPLLTPSGHRALANFQNLFGGLVRF